MKIDEFIKKYGIVEKLHPDLPCAEGEVAAEFFVSISSRHLFNNNIKGERRDNIGRMLEGIVKVTNNMIVDFKMLGS